MRKSYKLIYPALALLIIATSPKVNAKEYTFDYQKIVEVEESVEIDLELYTGSVKVIGNEEGRVVINAVKSVRASNRDEAEEVADHIEIKVNPGSKKITINTNYLKMRDRNKSFWSKFLGGSDSESFGRVDYIISVPTRTSIKITSMEAEIELSSLEGNVEIKNASGKTRGEYIFGDIIVSQPVGDIDLEWIEGDIRIKSNSSRIKIKQLQGAIDIATLSGKIHIQTELDSHNDYYVETTSGSVTFIVPETAAGSLDIETQTGDIKSDIPIVIKSVTRNKLFGLFGEGGPKIKISSTTGDVAVKQF